ncbi:MAG: hypothetical protein JO126_06425 [Alphaproteobacteria bacterium]|nr:hypothetical protein [Alphaproteobacteria bacterium]MBV8549074.1 hypothetical protein [Alphaproteobacteria bacterium]
MTLRIAWFNETPIQPDAKGQLASEDAQVRQRCLMPARTLENADMECSVFGNMSDPDLTHVSHLLQKLRTQIVVLRPFAGTSGLPLMRTAKHLGCYVVLDLGDGQTEQPELEQLVALADYVVAADATVQASGAHKLVIIPDCPPDALQHAGAVQAWRDMFAELVKTPPLCANNNNPDIAQDDA